MNLTRKIGLLAATVATAGGLALAGASAAGASTFPHAGPTSALFNVSFGNRHDNGNGSPSEWLLYKLDRNQAGMPTGGGLKSTITISLTGTVNSSLCPAGSGICKEFTVTMTATGSGVTVQGAGSPNATLPGNLNCRSFPVVLDGNSGLTETVYSRSGPVNNLNGDIFIGDPLSAPGFSAVPLLAFPAGGNKIVTSYRFGYTPAGGGWGVAAPIGWVDSSTNNDGNAPGDGQISCAS